MSISIRRASFGVAIAPLSVTKLIINEQMAGGLGKPISLEYDKGVLLVTIQKNDMSEIKYIIPSGNIASLEIVKEV